MDRVRQQQLPQQGPTLDILGMPSYDLQQAPFLMRTTDEAFTSENWIVRPPSLHFFYNP